MSEIERNHQKRSKNKNKFELPNSVDFPLWTVRESSQLVAVDVQQIHWVIFQLPIHLEQVNVDD